MLIGKLDLNKLSDRLRRVDRFLSNILKVRLSHGGLSDYVAENKRRETENGIFNKRRQEIEDQRIGIMKKWAELDGIDPNFAALIMYAVISESCRVQDELMVKKYVNKEGKINEADEKAIFDYQREELARLTSKVAKFYDSGYGKGLFGTKLYLKFEKSILFKLISSLENKDLAIDLGCATGISSLAISKEFKEVIGFDISPDMIAIANEKKAKDSNNVTFEVADLESGFELPENSVSLALMNMGTASDVKNIEKVLKNIGETLHPDGKFLLSFYNSESLLAKLGFLPWPMPMAAYIDQDKSCLEVHHDNEIYFIYAKPRSVDEVKILLSNAGLIADDIYTFPSCGSVLPNIVLENEDKDLNIKPNKDARKLIEKIDESLASSGINSGTYIIVTGGKK